ncbi:hypothetical protein VOLCADRAFT_105099 [Volvox carteri f. nagariensis]|uniref:Protein kinase domain-containing protein n=1 Tax=Volvox carteri f. nagariensis TaxID=3068 RepID=D8TYF1_VOLCA|nr:uncharacterized protein VOLCADRAFT_105099 [Volvox carteri f. nagariensis]EFJ47628.1 hypothetical protein VOLCADRAFT_105099 [Volvox carteri f. nagariensis]|eukprot:XP_002951452.1 hypothetical protein VOLCADRAFT_105099 [Volvox carteri f. nagariensis]
MSQLATTKRQASIGWPSLQQSIASGSTVDRQPHLVEVKSYLETYQGELQWLSISAELWPKDCQGSRQLHREFSVLSTSQPHPNVVVGLVGASVGSSGRPRLVTEYVPRCLSSELRTRGYGGLSGPEVKLLAWQLAQTIKHLHDKKIIHRDIKPANLLLDDAGVLRLCDFGSARFISSMREVPYDKDADAVLRVAARRYKAPEILIKQCHGPAADVWSFGCTVAELASGRPLLPGSSDADQMIRIMKFCGLPPYDPYGYLRASLSRNADVSRPVSPQLLSLLESCLRLDPNDRRTMDEILRSSYFSDVPLLIQGTELACLYDIQVEPFISLRGVQSADNSNNNNNACNNGCFKINSKWSSSKHIAMASPPRIPGSRTGAVPSAPSPPLTPTTLPPPPPPLSSPPSPSRPSPPRPVSPWAC